MRPAVIFTLLITFLCGCRQEITPMSPQKLTGKVYAGHRQFYVFDADDRGDTGSPAFFSEEAFKSRLPIGRGVVGVITSTDGEVPVTAETLLTSPPPDLANWAHIIEAPLHLTKGRAHLVGCPDEPTNMLFQVPPGDYTIRISFSSVTDTDTDTWNGDSYLIQIFPGKSDGRKILKSHPPAKSS